MDDKIIAPTTPKSDTAAVLAHLEQFTFCISSNCPPPLKDKQN